MKSYREGDCGHTTSGAKSARNRDETDGIPANFSKRTLRARLDLGEQLARMRTIGALPRFRGPPAGHPRPSGHPYDASKTVDMWRKIWKGGISKVERRR